MARPFIHFLGFNAWMVLLCFGIYWLCAGHLTPLEVIVQYLFFTVMTGGILWAAYRAVHQSNVHLFTALILGSVMGKLILSLLFLLVYTRAIQPEGKRFLLLFFSLYLGYTIYEVRTLIRLSKASTPH